MNAAKFEVAKTVFNGKVTIELIVRNATSNPELDALTTELGYTATTDIANRRSIFCTTAEQIDAARNPIARFFDAAGNAK